MARLASGQHPEGPGDAPKRRNGRSKGSKRPASPPPETPNNHNHVKRTKRVQVDDHDQLDRELQDSVSRSHDHDTIVLDDTRRRRNSEPPVNHTADDDEDSQSTPPAATQPLPGLTPHLQRVGAPRGRPSKAARHARMSMPAQLSGVDEEAVSADGSVELQFAPMSDVLDTRMRRRLRRSHLSEEVNEFEEHKKGDAKIRKEAAELRRQLQEKEARIQELEYQSEAQRMGNIDMSEDQHHALEKELEQARQEIEELKNSSVYAASEPMDYDNDDDGLVLVDPEDLGLTQEDLEPEPQENGYYATRASQMTVESFTSTQRLEYDFLAEPSQDNVVPDKVYDRAMKRYEGEIETLTVQIGEHQAAFRLLVVNLQNLALLTPGASTDDILTEIREICDNARNQLEALFPGTTMGATNGDVLRNIIKHLPALMTEIREKARISAEYMKKNKILSAELNAILEKLADAEFQLKELETKWYSLDRSHDKIIRDFEELQDSNKAANETIRVQDWTIKDNETKILGLEDELEDKGISIDRLTQALQGYRDDVAKLTETITRLEAEHAEKIATMEQEHGDAVKILQQSIDDQTSARALAEDELSQKLALIDDLEGKIAYFETEFENLEAELNRLRDHDAAEVEMREDAENDRDAHARKVQELQVTVEKRDGLLDDLRNQLESLKQNLDAEREQRETTEATLEQRNKEIKDLNDRIHTHGVQANELRAKLFQNQQQKENAIAALEQELEDKQASHEETLGQEIARRKDAERQLSETEKQVSTLEKELMKTEDALAEMERSHDTLQSERDTEVNRLDRELSNWQQKFKALQSSTNTTIVGLESHSTDLRNSLDAANAEIERLNNVAAAEAYEHTNEIERKDGVIAELEEDLEAKDTAIEDLHKHNDSLQKRVESEATEMLNIMDAHAVQADALQQTINLQQATIASMKKAAEEREAGHEQVITTMKEEIEALQVTGQNHLGTIEALYKQIEDMSATFKTAKEETDETIDKLNENLRNTLKQNEDLSAVVKKRNADALAAVQEMKVKGLEVKTNVVDLHRVSNGKITKITEKTKVTKKKAGRKTTRMRDSGYVFDPEYEDDGVEQTLIEAV